MSPVGRAKTEVAKRDPRSRSSAVTEKRRASILPEHEEVVRRILAEVKKTPLVDGELC